MTVPAATWRARAREREREKERAKRVKVKGKTGDERRGEWNVRETDTEGEEAREQAKRGGELEE